MDRQTLADNMLDEFADRGYTDPSETVLDILQFLETIGVRIGWRNIERHNLLDCTLADLRTIADNAT